MNKSHLSDYEFILLAKGHSATNAASGWFSSVVSNHVPGATNTA